jgi:alkylation response protein AidB-like acyl-CoA dehydrogenase
MSTTAEAAGAQRPREVSEREARQVAEAARETEWANPSFVRELFLGRLRMDLIHPLPAPDPEEQRRAAEFLTRLDEFAATVDGEEIEASDRVSPEHIDGLRRIGAFGIKIPVEYGGLGLSQLSYNRAISRIGEVHSALGVLLSAHQSIGVPQPLKMFGTPEQKKKYLPRLAQGAISAFALTEPDVGSDPARMSAHAEPTEDGTAYILNGEKLWCTNGPIAEVMVVMARTPPARPGGRPGITAFIVEADWEGVELGQRCEFMGLRGIENGVVRFTDVRVPAENVLWGVGRGLKLALITLNTGRLTIPATSAAAGKFCLRISREWAAERTQWGAPVGRHEAVAQKLADMAALTFAMDSINEVATRLADAGRSDIRLEAAIAKMFNSEAAWRVVGRGHAGPRRARLRDGSVAGAAWGTGDSARARDARPAHQPDLRRLQRDHASVHRARSRRSAPAACRCNGRSRGGYRRQAEGRCWPRRPLRRVASRTGSRAGTCPALTASSAAREASALRRTDGAKARTHAVPGDVALRPEAGEAAGGALPPRRRRRRTVRHGRGLRATRRSSCVRTRRNAARSALPISSAAVRGGASRPPSAAYSAMTIRVPTAWPWRCWRGGTPGWRPACAADRARRVAV